MIYCIEKNKGGWGMEYKAWPQRPYAVKVDGKLLKTKAGAVRTFGTRDSARKAAEKAIAR